MSFIMRVGLIVFSALLVSGCVGSASGQLLPSEALNPDALYFVARQEKDGRNLAADIAAGMAERGFTVQAGELGSQPANTQYMVTYVDRWMWDMRMYLSDLRIEVRDAEDDALIGYGQSGQSSLKAMGKSHQDVINVALTELFGP